MKIQEFYLDLREWPQYAKNNRNVWLLESEAFKEPLRFKFAFDDSDKDVLQRIENSCRDYYDRILQKEKMFDELLNKVQEKEKEINRNYEELEELSKKYDEILNQIKEKENLIKEKELKENDKIKEIQEKVNNIKKEIDLPKPSKIYSQQWEEFISWDDTYYWEPFNLPPWEYYVIETYEFEPQNEYVRNKNEIKIRKIYTDEYYIPEFQLYGSNAIDKPVAKVKLSSLFFQI